MPINRDAFFARSRSLFGGRYDQAQVDGLNAILIDWERRVPNGDFRWLAYMLATAFHETARTMQPVKEAYWLSEHWRQVNLRRYYPYYGRGYVQLTWANNYRRASAYVGADLVAHPDLALRPDFAASIMFVGMTEGWFRGDPHGPHTLSRYFNNRVDDPVGAREIINGREWKVIGSSQVLLATIIARYHNDFLAALSPARAPVLTTESEAAFSMEPGEGLRGAPPVTIELQGAYVESHDGGQLAGEMGSIERSGMSSYDGNDGHSYISADGVSDNLSWMARGGPDDLIQETMRFVSAYVSNNKLEAGDVPDFITNVHRTLKQLSETSAGLAPLDAAIEEFSDIGTDMADYALNPSDPITTPLPSDEAAKGTRGRSARRRASKGHH